MKKILVLSDSHSYFDETLKIFEKEKPDIVIAAGDGIKDIDELSYVHPEAKYYMVKGNCDFFDVIELPNNKTCVYIADVMGHGISASMITL